MTRNTPPNLPTSMPKMTTRSSRSISEMSALRIASRNDISEVPGERTAGLGTCGAASVDVATILMPLERQLIHVGVRVLNS